MSSGLTPEPVAGSGIAALQYSKARAELHEPRRAPRTVRASWAVTITLTAPPGHLGLPGRIDLEFLAHR